jgi:hypothetical protein
MASMAVVSMAAAFPYPYPQAPGPAGLAYPKAGPNGHYDAKHYFQVLSTYKYIDEIFT